MKELLLLAPESEEMVLKCPKCGDLQNQIISVKNTLNEPEYTTKYRQNEVEIEIECVCGEKTSYVFGQHKGQVFLETR